MEQVHAATPRRSTCSPWRAARASCIRLLASAPPGSRTRTPLADRGPSAGYLNVDREPRGVRARRPPPARWPDEAVDVPLHRASTAIRRPYCSTYRRRCRASPGADRGGGRPPDHGDRVRGGGGGGAVEVSPWAHVADDLGEPLARDRPARPVRPRRAAADRRAHGALVRHRLRAAAGGHGRAAPARSCASRPTTSARGTRASTASMRLAPEVIRLDRFLIAGVDGDPARQALTSSAAAFAAATRTRVIAEGIESGGRARRAASRGHPLRAGLSTSGGRWPWTTRQASRRSPRLTQGCCFAGASAGSASWARQDEWRSAL